jgi:flavin-dependent dehydrogenase
VNATGRGTLVSRSLGARRLRDDDLVAVYAWVPTSRRDGEARTLVETAADGWWYTSRLPDRSRVLVFHTRPEMARQLLKSPTDFRRRISETTHLRKLVAGRSRLPLRLACTEACGTMLDSVSGPGWIAAGDAAMAFDPLSSQGIFNALYSGMKAGQTIDRALEGDTGAVPAYRARLDEIRTTYLARRRLYYSMERRWLENPFWKGLSHGT